MADAYDAMTSKRSYRDPLPQQKVREEVYKGIGTQFDPVFARQMVGLIDADTAYTMREDMQRSDEPIPTRMTFGDSGSEYSEGVELNDRMLRGSLYSKPAEGAPEKEALPTLVIFDSLDARIHPEQVKQQDLLFTEYARIRLDGEISTGNVRRVAKNRVNGSDITLDPDAVSEERGLRYDILAVRQKDHIQIHIESAYYTLEATFALPDSTRFAYLSLTGSHCAVTGIRLSRDEEPVPRQFITRIAPEISYIEGEPVGDLANLQINGWRTDSTGGIPLRGKTVITFHSRSLPMARLIWHCPFILLFTSDNALVTGEHFTEYSLIRLDGETWESNAHAENNIRAEQTGDFRGWNDWKERNKDGLDITVTLYRDGNTVVMETRNLGLSLLARTVVLDEVEEIYAAITGDECAVTDIHVTREDWKAGDDPDDRLGFGEHDSKKWNLKNAQALKNVRGLLHREE